MRTQLIASVFATVLTFSSLAVADDHVGERAHSRIINNSGDVIGEAYYTQGTEGVLVEIHVEGLTPGKHGMHFHEVGTCKDYETFKMSGGHIMPSGRPHGYLYTDGGPHEGNLPNLIVAENGGVHVELYTELVSIHGYDGKPALLDDNGSALVIHANEDDYTTQPIGGAGGRVACGVVQTKG